MKKISLFISFLISLTISADIPFEDKVDFVIEKQLSSTVAIKGIKEATYTALDLIDIDISSITDFDQILNPFLDEYLDEIKIEFKDLYLETFNEDEISAYYEFISQDAGSSFMGKQVLMTSDVMEISFKVSNRMMNRLNNRLIRDYPELYEDLY